MIAAYILAGVLIGYLLRGWRPGPPEGIEQDWWRKMRRRYWRKL
jgi:hypothetical protein